MPFAREPRAAPFATRNRWTPGCGGEDLVARDQQHRQSLVGVERGEVFVPCPLDVEILTEQRTQVLEMAAVHRGANTAVIVRLSNTGWPSSFPATSTSA